MSAADDLQGLQGPAWRIAKALTDRPVEITGDLGRDSEPAQLLE